MLSFWQWRRLGRSGLLAGHHLRAEIDEDHFPQIVRRARAVRTTAHADDVPRDLNRREDKSPRDAPPAKKE